MSENESNEQEVVTFAGLIESCMNLASEQNYADAAVVAFEGYQTLTELVRESRGSSTPKIKQAAEEFEATDEEHTIFSEVFDGLRETIFDQVMERPNLSVLFYEGLKDYAQDVLKVYRDSVLRSLPVEGTDDEEVTFDFDVEDLKRLRTNVESFASIAELNGQVVDLPRKKKSGTIAFSNLPKSINTDKDAAEEKADASVTAHWEYEVDGEPITTRSLSDVATWHLSTATDSITSRELRAAIKKVSEPSDSEFTVEVNGRVLVGRKIQH